jgi:hypothetical protein
MFFNKSVSPQAPEYPIGAISNFYEILLRYLQLCVDRRCQRHRRVAVHWCQRHCLKRSIYFVADDELGTSYPEFYFLIIYRSGSDERAARSGHGVHDPLLHVRLCSRRHYKVNTPLIASWLYTNTYRGYVYTAHFLCENVFQDFPVSMLTKIQIPRGIFKGSFCIVVRVRIVAFHGL